MTTILLVVGVVVLFFVGLFSPHMAGKIQHHTNKKASRWKRMSDWLWGPIAWWSKNTIEITRKTIDVSSQWGKKARRKVDK